MYAILALLLILILGISQLNRKERLYEKANPISELVKENINEDSFWGSEHWKINTWRRVFTAIKLFCVSLALMLGLLLYVPKGMVWWWGILWCLSCGLLGLSFRAWQWRNDEEKSDPRSDKRNVAPPFPAYYFDYVIITIVNSLLLYSFLAHYLDVSQPKVFCLIAVPTGFYLGSVVKIMASKWLS